MAVAPYESWPSSSTRICSTGTPAESATACGVSPRRMRVNGTARIEDFRREFPAIGEVENAETLGGLLVDLLGVVPNVGESTTFRGLRFTAQAVDERRVRELLVEVTKGRPAK